MIFFSAHHHVGQKNVDEAVEKLKSKGIEVFGMACHVSSAEQRENLIKSTVQVSSYIFEFCCTHLSYP